MLLKLHHAQVSIPKNSEEAAKAFYCGVLGLQEIPKPASLQGRGGFWLELDGFPVHFGTEDGFDRLTTKSHLAYEVSDLELWRSKLAEHHIIAKDGIAIPGYVRFEFRDPFGNRVEFLQQAP